MRYRLFLLIFILFYCNKYALSEPKEEGIATGDEVVYQEYDNDDDDDEEEKKYIEETKKNETHHEYMNKLQVDLFRGKGYDKEQPPGKTIIHTTNRIKLDHFSIDEAEQTMSISGRICMIWLDKRIYWDSAAYSGVNILHVHPSLIWTPTMKVANSIRGNKRNIDFMYARLKIFAISKRVGSQIVACQRLYTKVGCIIDVANYPYDEHECMVGMTLTETYNNQVQLSTSVSVEEEGAIRHVETRDDSLPVISGWTLKSMISKTYYSRYGIMRDATELQQTAADRPVAIQIFRVKRHAPYYVLTEVFPSLGIALANISGTLTIHSAVSISRFIICLLLQGIMIQGMMNEIPLNYSDVPNIMRFWYIQLFLSIAGILFVVVRHVLRVNSVFIVVLPHEAAAVKPVHPIIRFFQLCYTFPGIYIIVNIISYILFL